MSERDECVDPLAARTQEPVYYKPDDPSLLRDERERALDRTYANLRLLARPGTGDLGRGRLS